MLSHRRGVPLSLALAAVTVGCSGSNAAGDATSPDAGAGSADVARQDGRPADAADTDGGDTRDYVFRQIGPSGGFVSSVVFHPTRPNEVWASGDDTSGLYRSLDRGVTWQFVDTGEHKNRASFSLRFDPHDSRRIFAPNHYGRGLLLSQDGGASWAPAGLGLPDASTPGASRRIYELAISPVDDKLVFAATGQGLYRSNDGAETFSKVTSTDLATESDFRAVVFSPSARVFVGGALQGVFDSEDGGSSWTPIIASGAAGAPPVSDIAISDNALYMAFDWGVVWKTKTFTAAGLSLVADPFGSTACVLQSSLWTRLAVVSGATAEQDTLYLGTVALSGSSPWGFFLSRDGGASCEPRMTGLDQNSVFALAVDPADSNHVLVGTVGGGLYRSLNRGDSWTKSDSGIFAGAFLAFAEDSSNPDHLLASTTTALENIPGVYESNNAGESWHELTALRTQTTSSLSVDPSDPRTLLAGTFATTNATAFGIYQTTSGGGGPWHRRVTANVQFQAFVRDTTDSDLVYASAVRAFPPSSVADIGIYVSHDGGEQWRLGTNVGAYLVAPRPGKARHAIAVGSDAFATTDAFATVPASLGLAQFAPGEVFPAAGFAPHDPNQALVGSNSGRLFVTNSYAATGMTADDWREVHTPFVDAEIFGIVITPDSHWYVSAWRADVDFSGQTRQGILRSIDQGQNWEWLHEGLGPSEAVFSLTRSVREGVQIYMGMYGGGLLLLRD